MTDIAGARRVLLARILDGDGEAPKEQRHAAFENAGLAEPVRTLLEKIARDAHRVRDDDIHKVLGSGVSEDQLFELAVCAALGQANRQYAAAMAVLAQASGKE